MKTRIQKELNARAGNTDSGMASRPRNPILAKKCTVRWPDTPDGDLWQLFNEDGKQVYGSWGSYTGDLYWYPPKARYNRRTRKKINREPVLVRILWPLGRPPHTVEVEPATGGKPFTAPVERMGLVWRNVTEAARKAAKEKGQ